jgi:hypothetical protein
LPADFIGAAGYMGRAEAVKPGERVPDIAGESWINSRFIF